MAVDEAAAQRQWYASFAIENYEYIDAFKWSWEKHRPGDEIYSQLWHIRRDPVAVTRCLPTTCPIPHARTRILDRRQTEGDVQRNFYVVEVTHQSAREYEAPELEHVDLSCILRYVSPDELERFENEQFRNEAELEAVVVRADAEELAQRCLAKNGVGRGVGMTSGLGLGEEVRTRGRPRGRGRGRAHRPRGMSEERLVDVEVDIHDADELQRVVEDSEGDEARRIIAKSDEESEEDVLAQTSPGLARSAFVANSALPLSPVIPRRRSSVALISPGTSTTQSEAGDSDTASISSAALQLRLEDHARGSIIERETVPSNRHRSKRRRRESEGAQSNASAQRALTHTSSASPDKLSHPSPHTNPVQPASDPSSDTESYTISNILSHYRSPSGTKYYLVKWVEYEDSQDWLPEEELGSAQELVDEYMRGYREKRRVAKKVRRRA